MSVCYREEYQCKKCNLFFNCTKECVKGVLFCPYCGAKEMILGKDAEYIKKLMELELHGSTGSTEKENYQYFWGMINFAKNQNHISNEEATMLYRLKNQFE